MIVNTKAKLEQVKRTFQSTLREAQ